MRKILNIKLAVAMLLLLCSSGGEIISQTPPVVSVDFPSTGMTDIAREPILQLSVPFPYKIDLSSMKPAPPDSLPAYDTLLNRLRYTQIFVMPSSVYNNNDSTLKLATVLGSRTHSSATSDTTFNVYTNRRLRYDTEYGIAVFGLRVYNTSTMDTLSIDTVIGSQFHTVQPLHRLVSTSFDNSVLVRCHDTLFTTFNRKIVSYTTPLGDMVTVKKITDTVMVDSLHFGFVTTPISGTAVLSPDSLTLAFVPDSALIVGEKYYLDVNVGYLTGDVSDNLSLAFGVRQTAKITIGAKAEDSTDVLPPGCTPYLHSTPYYIQSGEAFTLAAPKYNSDFVFLQWVCENNATINGKTSPELTFSLSCNELADLHIQALYGRVIVDTFLVDNGGIGGYVVVTGYQDSLGWGRYTLPRKEGESLSFLAVPTPGYSFTNWTSSNPALNGGTSTFMISLAKVNWRSLATTTTLWPGWLSSSTDCSQVEFCVNVYLMDVPEPGEDVRSMVALNIPLAPGANPRFATGCITMAIPPTPRPYTASFNITGFVTDPCIEVAGEYDADGQIRKGIYAGGGALGQAINEMLRVVVPGADCSNTLNIHIRKKRYRLTVEMEMEDLQKLPWYRKTDVKLSPQQRPMILNQSNPTLIYANDVNNKPYLQKVRIVYEYKCNETVKVYPWVETGSGYEPYEWVCPSPTELDLVCQPISSDPEPQTLTLVMDHDQRVRHRFRGLFRLRTIAFMDTTSGNEEKYYPNYDVDNGFPNDEDNIVGMRVLLSPNSSGYIPRTTRIKVGFSKPLQESSLENGGLFVEDLNNNLYGTSNERLDGRGFSSYFYKSLSPGPGNGYLIGSGDTAVITLVDKMGISIPHMSPLKLHITGAIRSSNGDVLQNPNIFTKGTEYPDLHIKVRSLKLKIPEEEPNEVFVNTYTAVGDQDVIGVPNYDNSARFPSGTDVHDMNRNDIYSINDYPLLFKRRLKYKDIVDWGYHAIDKDNGCAAEKFDEIIELVQNEKVKKIIPTNWNVEGYLNTAAAVYMVAEFIFDWLNDDDDTLDAGGRRSAIYDHLWDCYPLYEVQTDVLDGSSIDFQFTRALK